MSAPILPMHPDDIRARLGRNGECVGPLVHGVRRWVMPPTPGEIESRLAKIEADLVKLAEAVAATHNIEATPRHSGDNK